VKILITGASGFLGQEVIKQLSPDIKAICLSRKPGANLRGDILSWHIGLDAEKLKGHFDAIIHLAGLYDFRAESTDLQNSNVIGTHNALSFAKAAQIPTFINASTIAVAINSKNKIINAYELDADGEFPDHYSRTKAAGERLVKKYAEDMNCVINLRLGVLVGGTQSGKILRVDGPYHVIEAIRKIKSVLAKLPKRLPVPGSSLDRYPIIPVDTCAKAILRFLEKSKQESWTGYRSFNLTPETGMLAKEFYRDAFRHFNLADKKPIVSGQFSHKIMAGISRLTTIVPTEEIRYIANMPQFDSTETRIQLGEHWCPEYANFKESFWQGYEEYISNR
jgi:nucleoside-diphosphate-sugar epimerase